MFYNTAAKLVLTCQVIWLWSNASSSRYAVTVVVVGGVVGWVGYSNSVNKDSVPVGVGKTATCLTRLCWQGNKTLRGERGVVSMQTKQNHVAFVLVVFRWCVCCVACGCRCHHQIRCRLSATMHSELFWNALFSGSAANYGMTRWLEVHQQAAPSVPSAPAHLNSFTIFQTISIFCPLWRKISSVSLVQLVLTFK